MSFQQHVSEHQRREILKVLEQDPDYSHNSAVIQTYLGSVGHVVSSDKLHTELAWLEENGLITVKTEPVTVARLTQRGLDVAMGAAYVPGIARKSL